MAEDLDKTWPHDAEPAQAPSEVSDAAPFDDAPLDDAPSDDAPSDDAPSDDAPLDADVSDTLPATPVADEAKNSGDPEPEPTHDENSGATASSTKPFPEPVEAPRPEAPAPTVDAPQLRDVGAAFGEWFRGRTAAAGAFLSTHRRVALVLALACVGAILAMVLWGIDAAQTPSDEQILSDARDRLSAPAHTASAYEVDKPLVFQSAEVVRKQTSGTRHDACDVSIEAVFGNGSIESRADAQLTYVRKDDAWTCSAATVGKASHRALAGVSQERVLGQMGDLLKAADTDSDDESLASLYRDARIEVADEAFDADAQTDVLTLHASSTGTFVSYECDLTARFRFASASGAWELVHAQASDNARDLSFAPLVGTWRGTFAHQQAEVGKCLAAGSEGLTVVIEHAALTEGGGARIDGTVSGVAHLHPDLDEDADTTEGDRTLEAVPFSGTLSTGDRDLDVISLLAGNNPKSDAAGIVFDCTAQDLTEGRVTLTLTFGQADAPDAATAALTSTHAYQDYFLLFMPYQRQARFVDHFTLEKAS